MEGRRLTFRIRLPVFRIGRADPMRHAASQASRCRASHSPWVVLKLCWSLALGLGAHAGRELRIETERDVVLGDGAPWQAAGRGSAGQGRRADGGGGPACSAARAGACVLRDQVHGRRPSVPASCRCRGCGTGGRGTRGRGARGRHVGAAARDDRRGFVDSIRSGTFVGAADRALRGRDGDAVRASTPRVWRVRTTSTGTRRPWR